VATESTDEGKIGQFRRIWGPPTPVFQIFTVIGRGGLVQGEVRISAPAV